MIDPHRHSLADACSRRSRRRRPLLRGSASPTRTYWDDIALFAEDDGLVIDTRDLFRLRLAAAEGRLSAGAARARRRTTTGIFEFEGDRGSGVGGQSILYLVEVEQFVLLELPPRVVATVTAGCH